MGFIRVQRNFPDNILLTPLFTVLGIASLGYRHDIEGNRIYLSATTF
jgi:hypothetical protein